MIPAIICALALSASDVPQVEIDLSRAPPQLHLDLGSLSVSKDGAVWLSATQAKQLAQYLKYSEEYPALAQARLDALEMYHRSREKELNAQLDKVIEHSWTARDMIEVGVGGFLLGAIITLIIIH
jgi:hypothetical protein